MDGLPKFANVGNERSRLREVEIEIPPNGNSLDLLQAVYRCSSLPLTTRMRAALGAIQHEVPKLLATAITQDNDIATLLDRRIARYQEMERTKLIEHTPTNIEANGNWVDEPVEVKPTPSINYRAIKLKRRI